MPPRLVTDVDIAAYAAYRRKLAAIATTGDPPPHSFRTWFESRYHASPIDDLVSDQTAWFHGRQLRRAQLAARAARARRRAHAED